MNFFSHLHQSDSSHWELFLKLLTRVHKILHDTTHILACSCIVGNESVTSESDILLLTEACDFIAIFHDYSNVGSPFDAYNLRKKAVIEDFFDNLLKRTKSKPHKFLLGLPFTSPEFVLNPKPFFYRTIDYNIVCDIIMRNNYTKLDKDFKPADLACIRQFESETQINSVIVFECSRSVANKMRFVVEKRMGGTMISALHEDDVDGKCGTKSNYGTINIPKRNKSSNTLLRTINEAFSVNLGEIQQDSSHSSRHLASSIVLMSHILVYLLVLM